MRSQSGSAVFCFGLGKTFFFPVHRLGPPFWKCLSKAFTPDSSTPHSSLCPITPSLILLLLLLACTHRAQDVRLFSRQTPRCLTEERALYITGPGFDHLKRLPGIRQKSRRRHKSKQKCFICRVYHGAICAAFTTFFFLLLFPVGDTT